MANKRGKVKRYEEEDERHSGVDKNELVQLKTGLGGKEFLKSHLWRPKDLARLWDRLDQNYFTHAILFSPDSNHLSHIFQIINKFACIPHTLNERSHAKPRLITEKNVGSFRLYRRGF